MSLPPELKKMKRFVREAQKLVKVKPVVSYYCRLYAIQEAMALPKEKKTTTVNNWLGEQMTLLENTKQQSSRDEAKLEILEMGNNAFKYANEVDLNGKADKKCAGAFNSAYVFYEILKQFGDRDEKIVERAKYSLYKTTDILKALREGRTPEPGPPGGLKKDDEEDEFEKELNKIGNDDNTDDNNNNNVDEGEGFNQPQNNNNFNNNFNNNNNNYNQNQNQNQNFNNSYNQNQNQNQNFNNNMNNQNFNNNQNNYSNFNQNNNFNNNQNQNFNNNNNNYNNQRQQPKQQPRMQPNPNQGFNIQSKEFRKFENKIVACGEAEKMMKHAFSAMKFNDINTAIEKLQKALAILNQYKD